MNIKEKPEDFRVEEIIDLDKKPGNYLYIKLTKKNRNTLDVVSELSRKLKIQRKDIGYAGIKDKRAVTTQYISIRGISKLDIELKECTYEVLHKASVPIVMGSLKANKFKIKIDFIPKQKPSMINLFGEQRFSENNEVIGKLIFQSKFKEALELIDSEVAAEYLIDHVNDYVGAIRRVDKKLVKLYLHAYQSHLWNKVASDYKKVIEIPLMSFNAKYPNKQIELLYEKLLKREEMTKRDFIIKQIPELTPVATYRHSVVKITNYKFNKPYVEFQLPKGSYATTALKKLF
jgi:tRNA(Glu) U13 pseudouridine synthase TruD